MGNGILVKHHTEPWCWQEKKKYYFEWLRGSARLFIAVSLDPDRIKTRFVIDK
jgi:hypothetical protein